MSTKTVNMAATTPKAATTTGSKRIAKLYGVKPKSMPFVPRKRYVIRNSLCRNKVVIKRQAKKTRPEAA